MVRNQRSSSSGFLDRVWGEGLAGWSLSPSVMVSVNGAPSVAVDCAELRPDVKAAGLAADGRVGFQAKLCLANGDIVRVITEQGAPLRHSPWLYLAPGADGWVPVPLAAHHPEYSAIAELAEALAVERFRPLFGQLGQVTAAVIDSPGEALRVARFGVAPWEARYLWRFHQQVLEPTKVACPALQRELSIGGKQVLVFDYCSGITLDRYGQGWEAWLPAVMVELSRLQQVGESCRGELARHGGRKRSVFNRLLRQTMSDVLLGRKAAGERRFLVWLLATLWRLPRVLSHGDLHRENVLVDAETGNIALIDWDRWAYLPLGFDLALLMRGLPGETAEHLVEGSPHQRLGVVGFTYLFQRLDRPGFAASAVGCALRERCRVLAGKWRKGCE